jgi:hypothetical protein
MDIMNHKGTWCIVDYRLCQEGYCSECELSKNVKVGRSTNGYPKFEDSRTRPE